MLLVLFHEHTVLLAMGKTSTLPHVNEFRPVCPAKFVGRFNVIKTVIPSALNTADTRPMRLVNANVGELLG